MRKATRLALVVISIALFGVVHAASLLPGDLKKENNFVYVALPVTSFKWNNDGSLTLRSSGTIRGKAVGFVINLNSEWVVMRTEEPPIKFYRSKGSIRSTGKNSNAFLSLLATEFGLSPKRIMALTTAIIVESRDSDPKRLSTVPVTFDVFLEALGTLIDGEASLSINLPKKAIWLRCDKGFFSHLAGGT